MSQEAFAFLAFVWAFIFGVGYILANRREKKFEEEMQADLKRLGTNNEATE